MADEGVQHHRQRLRERFFRHGLSGFQDYEILELLLTYAIPRKDVKPLAKALLDKFGSLAAVMDASPDAIESLPGLGRTSALLIHLVRDLNGRYLLSELPQKDLLNSPQSVKDLLRLRLQGRQTECFGVVFMDQQHHYIELKILFEGTVDRAAVYPREIMRHALALQAKALILFHNHPGGSPQASQADIDLTTHIEVACNALDLRLLDHFLVAGDKVLSFREHGWYRPSN
jgi:DNA repair protein RadC